MVLATVAVVALRYLFGQGAILLQESVIYMHGMVFMLGIPYALHHNNHVRVDVFATRLGTRGRNWVELIGHLLFLLPVSSIIFIYSLPYVAASWRVFEGSGEVGGIPAVFLLKTLLPLMATLLFLQGIAEMIRLIRELRAADRRGPAS
jgi:TRAP-type mannitol/chloroaromatic compound transport system permease small subunit